MYPFQKFLQLPSIVRPAVVRLEVLRVVTVVAVLVAAVVMLPPIANDFVSRDRRPPLAGRFLATFTLWREVKEQIEGEVFVLSLFVAHTPANFFDCKCMHHAKGGQRTLFPQSACANVYLHTSRSIARVVININLHKFIASQMNCHTNAGRAPCRTIVNA